MLRISLVNKTKTLFLLLTVVAGFAVAASAQAGFEWVPPVKQAAPATQEGATQQTAVPAPAVQMLPLEVEPAAAPQQPAAPAPSIETVQPAPQHILQAPANAVPTPAPQPIAQQPAPYPYPQPAPEQAVNTAEPVDLMQQPEPIMPSAPQPVAHNVNEQTEQPEGKIKVLIANPPVDQIDGKPVALVNEQPAAEAPSSQEESASEISEVDSAIDTAAEDQPEDSSSEPAIATNAPEAPSDETLQSAQQQEIAEQAQIQEPAQQPAQMKTRIVMPPDAPANATAVAVQKTENINNPVIATSVTATLPEPAAETASIDIPEEALQTEAEAPQGGGLKINPFPLGTPPADDAQPQAGAQDSAAQPPLAASEVIAFDTPASQQGSPVVEGFGSDMPLALALQQVVPPGYALSFSPGVNPGVRVSWNGGKSWSQVIDEMLAPLGLTHSVKGKTIHIQKFSKSSEAVIPEAVKTEDTARANITDPGIDAQAQPEETIARIERIAEAPAASSGTLDGIEPASSSSDAAVEHATAESAPWEAKKGESLQTTLESWSSIAGVNVMWDLKEDYTLNSDISLDGSFEDAVKTIFNQSIPAEKQPALNFIKDANTGTLNAIFVEGGDKIGSNAG